MSFYARPSWQLARQLTADLFMVAWTIGWWLTSRAVEASILALAEPARQTATAAQNLKQDFLDAGRTANEVPMAGDDLSKPFESAARSLGDLVFQASTTVHQIQDLAFIMGWVVFLVPVALLLALWLPARIRFYLRARAARSLIDESADLDLFALRAMASQPMHRIAKISSDPVAAWRDGDREIIDRLAELELRRAGLRMRKRPKA